MALPVNWKTVPVTGTFVGANGTPAKGHIRFVSDQVVVSEGVVIVPREVKAELDATGSFSIELPATNDPDIAPASGWTYTVIEAVRGGREPYGIFVPFDAVGVDLSTVTPTVPSTSRAQYTLIMGTVTVGAEGTDPVATLEDVSPGVQRLSITLPVTNVSGMTQTAADARYVRLPIGGTEGDVATNNGLDGSEWRAPTIPLASANW
jgi:hypothetical protein